ncbi:hypothetical protein GJ744_003272 [Endocarpon pusillum]|uniref:Uncharacterized protein n=1 Tax=Endocarpon pusillum TaxID=364733 RepID=A0A8H7AEK1_9EURO|nr:hypothetical protein GJ744_003272 [Endocarpon pusillum]
MQFTTSFFLALIGSYVSAAPAAPSSDGDFPAILSPSIAIFPPPPQGFEFGGPGETVAQFGAFYACDSTGKQYIKLATESAQGFILTSVAEGQRVYIKPQQFQGSAVDVSLRINGGQ